jgi:hypothetical protein
MNEHALFPAEADRLMRQPDGVYFHDYAGEIDTEVDLICEALNVGPALAQKIKDYKDAAIAEAVDWGVAQILSIVLAEFIRPAKNIRAKIYGLLFATGLDSVNALHSQAEIARQIGCTRALISHYTTFWADRVRVGVFKFRKSESSRATFSESARLAWREKR